MKKLLVSLMFFLVTSVLQASEIVVSPSCRFASLVLTENEYAQWDDSLFETYTQKIYEKFNDDFDFIVFVLNEPTKPAKYTYYGINYLVSAQESGIGLESSFDNTQYYGSAGRLQSVIHLPMSNGIAYGPFLHEIEHRWANYAFPSINFNNYSVPSHWGIMGGSTPGQLGGFQESLLESNIDGSPSKYKIPYFGQYANFGNSVPYNDLELYLMGMIPLSQVQPFTVFNSIDSSRITSDAINKTNYYIFSSQEKTTYSPTTIEALLGQRVPDYTASQKNFKILFVVVSDSSLTTEEYAQYDADIESFCRPASNDMSMYNFWEATRGIGTLTAEHIDASLKQTTSVAALSSDSEVALYPNVVENEGFYIKNVSASASYAIYDVAGVNVAGGAIPSNGPIPSSSLKPGIYMVSVVQGDRVKVLKLIKK